MNARDLINLIRLIISKIFLKAIFWFAILIFIASLLPWTKGIYDHIFSGPELRITESSPSQDRQVENKWLYQRVAVVENRGNSTANQVYVTTSVPGGRIDKYEIFADHPYTVHPNTDVSRGYLVLSLDRLSPGAKITIYVWGSRVENGLSGRMFAAVYDAGSAPITEEPSSEEQIRNFTDMLLANLAESLALVKEKVIGPEGIRNNELAFGDISVSIPQIPSHLTISAITLAFLAWLFLDSARAALVHGGLAFGICWLIVPLIVIPSKYMFLSTLPFIFFIILKKVSLGRGSIGYKSRWILALSGFFWLFILVNAIGVWSITREVTDCVTVGYLATVLSLELL